jgi:hypothetical protein
MNNQTAKVLSIKLDSSLQIFEAFTSNMQDNTEHIKRSRLLQQIGAPPKLRFVSQPKGI